MFFSKITQLFFHLPVLHFPERPPVKPWRNVYVWQPMAPLLLRAAMNFWEHLGPGERRKTTYIHPRKPIQTTKNEGFE